jgi:DNA-binding NarL/FixJ family response regulator
MTTNAEPVRVMLMEQEEDLRHWLGRLVDHTPGFQCVGRCHRAERLEAEALRLRPDLLLLDSHSAALLPAGLLIRLRKALPGLYVVLMDLEEGPGYERLARRAGADGFLSKARVPEALAALRTRFKQRVVASPA